MWAGFLVLAAGAGVFFYMRRKGAGVAGLAHVGTFDRAVVWCAQVCEVIGASMMSRRTHQTMPRSRTRRKRDGSKTATVKQVLHKVWYLSPIIISALYMSARWQFSKCGFNICPCGEDMTARTTKLNGSFTATQTQEQREYHHYFKAVHRLTLYVHQPTITLNGSTTLGAKHLMAAGGMHSSHICTAAI